MRNEQIRKELEKKFTHVTFVKTTHEGKDFESTVWTVNDEMETISIATRWEVTEILHHLEMNKLAKIANTRSEKYSLFKHLMKEGIIETDHTLYKKTTFKKLQQLL